MHIWVIEFRDWDGNWMALDFGATRSIAGSQCDEYKKKSPKRRWRVKKYVRVKG